MDQERVEVIYHTIEGLHIELDPDPTVLGARYIMERVAKCRNNLNIVSQLRQSISRERRDLKKQLSGEEACLAIERDNLLASNEIVRKQPNIRDREAVVNTMLRDRLNRISQLKADILDLDTVEQPVKMVHDELTRTATEIRTQRSMIQADRISGAGYGDESGDYPRSHKEDDLDEEALDRIMREQVPLVASGPFKAKAEENPDVAELSHIPSDPVGVNDSQEGLTTESYREAPEPEPEPVSNNIAGTVEEFDVDTFLANDVSVFPAKSTKTKKAKAEPPKAEPKAELLVEEDVFDFEKLLQGI
jgi:hypothetical protein